MATVRLVQRIPAGDLPPAASHVLVSGLGDPYVTACGLSIAIGWSRTWPGEPQEATCPTCARSATPDAHTVR